MERGGREYSIGELADQAGVSTRTIRYYVSEGLLPPPVGAGPGSRYTDAHREQLEIIGRLKEQYLPLKEIRRRLIGHGLLNVPPPAGSRLEDAAESPPLFGTSWPEDDAPVLRQYLLAEADPAGSPPETIFAERLESTRVNAAPPPPALGEEQAWRRVAISDEAEMLISERQYRRHRDKIDWLAQWAGRVLDG